jgi:hypothetical protein
MSTNVKVAKKGEFIFKEGDKISQIFLIQSGSSILCIARPKKNIDMFPVGAAQVLGEQAFLGMSTHTFSLMANSGEVKYMEIPVEIAKAQIEAAPQFLKVLIKSLSDRLKTALADMKSARMEKDSSPCPEDQVAKCFGSIYHTAAKKAKSTDEKNPNVLTMDWVQLKQYCQRIFGESPRRIEQACNLLVKLKMVSYIMGKPIDDPEGPDEIQKINFLDLPAVEAFFEFYQYYYFKGGAASIIKYDESSYNLLTCFLKMAETLPVDKFGVVAIEFPKAVEYFKTEFNINLSTNQFSQLEGKGVFAKRQARTEGPVILSFEIREWQTTQKIWRIIREIDKWNERGFIDMNEEENKPKKKPGALSCPTCQAEIAPQAKFCMECGTKLEVQGQTKPSGDGGGKAA